MLDLGLMPQEEHTGQVTCCIDCTAHSNASTHTSVLQAWLAHVALSTVSLKLLSELFSLVHLWLCIVGVCMYVLLVLV